MRPHQKQRAQHDGRVPKKDQNKLNSALKAPTSLVLTWEQLPFKKKQQLK